MFSTPADMPQGLIVTPPGTLIWAAVLKPKLKNAGKSDEKLVYECDLLLAMADKDAQALIGTIKGVFSDRFGANARPGSKGIPVRRYVDEAGDETDIWKLSFSRNVVTARGTALPPPVVQDSKGTPWPADLLIGNGSEGKIAFKPWTWDSPDGGKGVSLELHGVRVLSHVPYEAADAAAAFGDPEAGCDVGSQAAADPFAGAPPVDLSKFPTPAAQDDVWP